MKFLLADILLFVGALCLAAAAPALKCPSEDELGNPKNNCKCYDAILALHCTNIQEKFNLKSSYVFKSIVINDSPRLPYLLDHASSLDNNKNLQTDSLVILNTKAELKTPFSGNLEDFLGSSVKSIKIISTNEQKLDIAKFQGSLESIIIDGVNVITHGYESEDGYFSNAANLKHIVVRRGEFKDALDTTILKGPIDRIEFTNTNIKGLFHFEPTVVCEAGKEQKIHIELNDNLELTSIDFATLFDQKSPSKDCLFHITLSGKPGKLAKLFEDKTIQKVLSDNVGRFYLQLRNFEIECSCGIYTLYNFPGKNAVKLSDYIHGLYCVKEKLYIDQIKTDDLTKKKMCPPGP